MSIKDISCPECGHRLKLRAHPHKGQRVFCPSCEVGFTITGLNPVELELTTTVNEVTSTKKRPHIIEVPCPECEDLLKINSHIHPGHRVRCSKCDAILEVASTNPLELDVVLTDRLKYSPPATFDEDPRRPAKKTNRTRKQSR
jgi:lysine biosynthesis protein LysW